MAVGAAIEVDLSCSGGGGAGTCMSEDAFKERSKSDSEDGDIDENAGFASNILESGSTAPVPRGREAPVGCPKSKPDPAVCKSNDKSGTDDRV